jgi:hypothetical protein
MSKKDAEAEELEKKAKDELKRKNYELAMDFFKKAKNLYLEINYIGKVEVIDKQIRQLKRAIEYEQRTKVKDVINVDKKAEYVKQQTQSARNGLLSEAETRREKLKEQAEQKEKEAEIKRFSDAKIEQQDLLKNQEVKIKQEELEIKTQKENGDKILIKNGENLLDSAKRALKNNEFMQAKNDYRKAIDIFKSLGWNNQVDILYKEIKNIDTYETEYQKKGRSLSSLEQKKNEEFQKQVNLLLEEKKKREEIVAARLKKLPSDLKKIIEKVKMLYEKAEKEVQANMIHRALDRYQYILELYQSIPIEKLDLSYEISEIKKKISELEPKV